jgi:hypothetical protein
VSTDPEWQVTHSELVAAGDRYQELFSLQSAGYLTDSDRPVLVICLFLGRCVVRGLLARSVNG